MICRGRKLAFFEIFEDLIVFFGIPRSLNCEDFSRFQDFSNCFSKLSTG